MDCHEVKEHLFSYLDGEMAEGAEVLEAHVAECLPCMRRVTLEKAFLKVIKARAAGRPVPTSLENRIRTELLSRGPSAGVIPKPIFVLAAASVLVTLLGFTLIVRSGGSTPRDTEFVASGTIPVAAVQGGQLEGDVVCIGCAVACSKTGGMPHEHHLGIQARDGRIWHILETPVGREILGDHNHIGEQIHVEGVLYTAAQTVAVRTYSY